MVGDVAAGLEKQDIVGKGADPYLYIKCEVCNDVCNTHSFICSSLFVSFSSFFSLSLTFSLPSITLILFPFFCISLFLSPSFSIALFFSRSFLYHIVSFFFLSLYHIHLLSLSLSLSLALFLWPHSHTSFFFLSLCRDVRVGLRLCVTRCSPCSTRRMSSTCAIPTPLCSPYVNETSAQC